MAQAAAADFVIRAHLRTIAMPIFQLPLPHKKVRHISKIIRP